MYRGLFCINYGTVISSPWTEGKELLLWQKYMLEVCFHLRNSSSKAHFWSAAYSIKGLGHSQRLPSHYPPFMQSGEVEAKTSASLCCNAFETQKFDELL